MEDLLRLCQQGDAFARKKAKELSSAEHDAKDSTWSIEESGLLRYKGAAYVPPDKALQSEIMKVNHDDAQGGHFGRAGRMMLFAISITGHRCRMTSIIMYGPAKGANMRRSIGIRSMDFITGLPLAMWQGRTFDAILVIVDPFTEGTEGGGISYATLR
jgi:hypothetical protein